MTEKYEVPKIERSFDIVDCIVCKGERTLNLKDHGVLSICGYCNGGKMIKYEYKETSYHAFTGKVGE